MSALDLTLRLKVLTNKNMAWHLRCSVFAVQDVLDLTVRKLAIPILKGEPVQDRNPSTSVSVPSYMILSQLM
jgi:hypothetical protein